jgi:hypothetical protein
MAEQSGLMLRGQRLYFSVEELNVLERGDDNEEVIVPSLPEVDIDPRGCGSLIISILTPYNK